ncbi:MAG: prephenate dehydrogenase [Saprospiraceae bacterium]|nr:prephenate dehydrogenase [Saprospiraceae bacterium]
MIITVIGIGLIGGSLALSLKQNGFADKVLGVDQNESHGEKAKELGIVDEIVSFESGIKEADLIVLAAPVNAIVKILPKVLDLVDHQIVIDVGSTKEGITLAVKGHQHRGRFVATHPMAGTEYSGPEAAIPDLFTGKCTVIVDREDSDPDAVKTVEEMYQSLQMNIVYHHSHEHDIHTAYVSHISHISSFALALTVLEKEKNEKRIFELAGGGFSSTVRLAKSNPETWVPIFEQNRDYVLDVLDEHINTISKFRTLLIKKDFESFYKLIQQANQIRRIVN